ncbi:MAG: hypothetical protein GTO20_04440 [Candidatus Aminicenantes bacterium]|nr:hypothetical protein [Candidatus Aminicenantes bacterium]
MTNTDNNSSLKIEKSTAEITTIDQLAQSLAGHTRFISDNIIIDLLKQSKSSNYLLPSAPCSTLFTLRYLSPPPVVPVFFHHEVTKNTKVDRIPDPNFIIRW